MLYLGRISPVKNLCMLVKVMAGMGDTLQNWLLVIAGKDEFDYCAELEATIRELHMEKQVRFVGSLYDEDKRNAFAAAELFVLPSLRESSSLVVLESLGAATPVLTTKGTPWQELETYQCGWWSDINVDAISAVLYKATHLSREQLKTMEKGDVNWLLNDIGGRLPLKNVICSINGFWVLQKSLILLYNRGQSTIEMLFLQQSDDDDDLNRYASRRIAVGRWVEEK